jgi:hypothetical protein
MKSILRDWDEVQSSYIPPLFYANLSAVHSSISKQNLGFEVLLVLFQTSGIGQPTVRQ